MAETLLEELKRYVQFDAKDAQALRALHAIAAPHFAAISDAFYARILSHDQAARVLTEGESQVLRLRLTLQAWLDTLLRGPWEEAYFEARCRIGRMHVRIALPQQYMFGAMNVIRRELNQIVDDAYLSRPVELAAARRAVGKILDLELAIMLHTYREDLLAQQARIERLSTFGQLVGSMGHDLRNPLGVIETSLYILRQRIGDDEKARRHADRIGEQLAVANGIISNLLDMIRDRPLRRERVRLDRVLGGAVDAVRRPEGVRIALRGLEAIPEILGDESQLRQVFVNLIENAVHAASPQGEVHVLGRPADGAVEIDIEDTGPGVDPATLRRLFEPLITTKERGIGLGLSLVKRIAERHGGTVRYDPPPAGGARFTVRLPL